MKLKTNDKVVVIAGKDKGKVGRITRVITKQNRLIVEGVNMRTKHIKKTQNGPGEKVRFEAPIDNSNVMILDPKENKPTRIGYRMADGKKERFAKLSGSSLDIVSSETKEVKKIEEKEEKTEKPKAEKKPRKKTTIKA